MQQKFSFIFFLLFLSCGRLQVDDTTAFPLVGISETRTPAFEDIREFVPYRNLIYAAAGSGGILTYRLVGDNMSLISDLSLTNLVAENLEQLYIRTVEVVETLDKTNLIFSYDTLSGGGIGLADISETYTRPVGTLKVIPNLRLKNTITTLNQDGTFHILAAEPNMGILSFMLSFTSNSYTSDSDIASLVDLVAQLDIEAPLQGFATLGAPGQDEIISSDQITNADALLRLAQSDPQQFSYVIERLPFLSDSQKAQISQLAINDPAVISNILNIARNSLGEEQVNDLLQDPAGIADLLNNPLLSQLLGSGIDSQQLSDALSTAQVQQLISSLNSTNDEILIPRTREEAETVIETDTLFEESYLSNLSRAGFTNVSNQVRFYERPPVQNANQAIEGTLQDLGRRYFTEENEVIKNALYNFDPEQLASLFASLFQQAETAIALIPLFENAGLNISELYRFWQEQDYQSIIESIDASLIAEVLRHLPRYQVDTSLDLIGTNFNLSTIRDVSSDESTLYIAAGVQGFYIVDRLTGTLIDNKQKPFSDVSVVVPHTMYGRDYYIVADRLDGLLVYERLANKRIGEQIARLTLVGEAFDVRPYQDILWIADGSDGVVGVRFNQDRTLTIEAEIYEKTGIAYYIGAVRRREVLASYGADGLLRLRITNVVDEGAGNTGFLGLAEEDQDIDEKDFIDRMIEWGFSSPMGNFLRRLFAYI